MLTVLNSYMEQDDKMLLLIYLLKVSIAQSDDQDFTVVAETLYHLSFVRRFTDAFISMLEQISLFGKSNKKRPADVSGDELKWLFIMNSEFFEDCLTPDTKVCFLGFLTNVFKV